MHKGGYPVAENRVDVHPHGCGQDFEAEEPEERHENNLDYAEVVVMGEQWQLENWLIRNLHYKCVAKFDSLCSLFLSLRRCVIVEKCISTKLYQIIASII